ncbi:MAG: leucine-rich repeat domain-containing protein [Clostridia bacterium]|nr:leucine-rich repeat domain-containing protein [Clostridia bacterium]
MKRKPIFILLILALLTLPVLLAGCGDEPVDLSGISLADAEFTYDGTPKSIAVSGTLPKGISVSYEGNGVTDAGTYTVKAKFYRDGSYLDGKDMTATLTVAKADYDMSGISLGSMSVLGDGEAHSVYISGTLPEGVSVSYEGNGVSEFGKHTVIATFTADTKNHNPIPPMESSIIIMRSDLEGITFADATVKYDGTVKSISIDGTLPEGVSVEYSPADITEVGEYAVTASFISENELYSNIPDMTATLKVTKGTYDMSGVVFEDISIPYDGKYHTVKVSGDLPEGISVFYLGNNIREAGAHKVYAQFYGDGVNYEPIPNMQITVYITSSVLPGVTFSDKSFTYDDTEKSISVSGTLPEGVSVSYEDNSATNVGAHRVTASFTSSNPLYADIADMYASIVIVKAEYKLDGLSFEGKSVPLDGEAHSIYLSGTLPPDVEVEYVGNGVVGVGAHTVTAKLIFSNTSNYKTPTITSLTATITVTAPDGASDGISYTSDGDGSLTVSGYNGSATIIVIPESVDGAPVAAIADGAFASCTDLEYVYIPSSVKSVGAMAFDGCTSLHTVDIASGTERIGAGAFKSCSSLDSIFLPASVVEISATDSADSPFLDCDSDLIIVLESAPTDGYGAYWRNTTSEARAKAVYMKTHAEFITNADVYRSADSSSADLSGIYLDGAPLQGFDNEAPEYDATVDINSGYPTVTVTAASASAGVAVTAPSSENGGVATVTVKSGDLSTTRTFIIRFTVTGTFEPNADVVGKNDTKGTVSFVIDDGHQPTAQFGSKMLDKYPDLSLTYALITDRIATLKTTYDSSGARIYLTDENGKYTYAVNESALSFWKSILAGGRTEIISHTHTHAFWGNNDDGGTQYYTKNDDTVAMANLPVGSASADVFAPMQILEELLGITSRTLVEPGIGVKNASTTVAGVVYPSYYTYFDSLVTRAIESNTITSMRRTFGAGTLTDFSRYVYTKDYFATEDGRKNVYAMMVRPTDNIESWKTYIDNAVEKGGLAAYCIHQITPAEASGHYILEKDAEELFAYAVSKDVWVAGYTAATNYYTEWASAEVNAVYGEGGISVTLTDDVDNSIFNEKLTVKLAIPATWTEAYLEGEALEIYDNIDGTRYVLVDLLPDSGDASITPAK